MLARAVALLNRSLLLVIFTLAAAGDWVSCQWLLARDTNAIGVAVAFAMVLECLAWIPVWFAIRREDWRIAAAAIAGSGLGTAIGLGFS